MKLINLLKKLCYYILGYFTVSFTIFEIFTITHLTDNDIFCNLAATSYFIILSVYFMIKSINNYKNDKPVKLSIIYKIFTILTRILNTYDPNTDHNFHTYCREEEERDIIRTKITRSTNKYINCKFNIIIYTINIIFIIELLFYKTINGWFLLGTFLLYPLSYTYLFFTKKS